VHGIGAMRLLLVLLAATAAAAAPSLDQIRAGAVVRERALFPRGLRYRIETVVLDGKERPKVRTLSQAIWYDDGQWALRQAFQVDADGGTLERAWFHDGKTTYIVVRGKGEEVWRGYRQGGWTSAFNTPAVAPFFWSGRDLLSKSIVPEKARLLGPSLVEGRKCIALLLGQASVKYVLELDPKRLFLPLRVTVGTSPAARRASDFNPPRRTLPGDTELLVLSQLVVKDVAQLGERQWVPKTIEQVVAVAGVRQHAHLVDTTYTERLDPEKPASFLGDYWIHDRATDSYIGTQKGRAMAEQEDRENGNAIGAHLRTLRPGDQAGQTRLGVLIWASVAAFAACLFVLWSMNAHRRGRLAPALGLWRLFRRTESRASG